MSILCQLRAVERFPGGGRGEGAGPAQQSYGAPKTLRLRVVHFVVQQSTRRPRVTRQLYFHAIVAKPLTFFFALVSRTILSLPKCGKGKPALLRRNTVDDKNELIACIENGNFAKAARIAAGKLDFGAC